jgi:hypothetical protein
MNKLAAMMVLGLLPLAGCATPYDYYPSGPYTAYDADYDQGYDGYGPPAPTYGSPGFYAGYSGPGYYGYYASGGPGAVPYGQAYYGPGPGYSQSGYASAYYSAPPAYGTAPAYGPPQPYSPPYRASSYSSTTYRCGCDR